MNWFEVDKQGLSKLLHGRPRAVVVHELVQNAWDTGASRVDVFLRPVPSSPHVEVEVVDDDPDGFKDLSHAFTLFAESDKKGRVDKRGRFNLGEKLVLSLCDRAVIETTTGTVTFDGAGRRKSRARREAGSRFWGLMRMTRAEHAEVLLALKFLIPPSTCVTAVNGEVIEVRKPLATIEAALPTEIADEDGVLRRTRRKTAVHVYEPLDGETPSLYELGIPVVEHDCRWHVDCGQKVPLTMSRDNAPPAFLREVRALVVNAMHDYLSPADASSGWVRDAAGSPEATDEAVRRVLDLRFGEKRVSHDPSDPEANKIAVSKGYVVVHGGMMSGEEWTNARRAEAILPAGKVTPSPKPYSPDGEKLNLIPLSEWTDAMHHVAVYAKWLAVQLLGRSVKVQVAAEPGWGVAATYGKSGVLTLNRDGLPKDFFDGGWNSVQVDALLLHEFAHEHVSDHLSSDFHEAICQLGARLRRLPEYRL